MAAGPDKPVPELRWVGRYSRVSRHDPGDRLEELDAAHNPVDAKKPPVPSPEGPETGG